MSIDRNIVIKLHKKFSKIIIYMSIDHNIVIKLHKSGESNSEIAKRLKMNSTTVWKIIKKFQEIGTTLVGKAEAKMDCLYQGEAAMQLSSKLQELGCCSWCRQIQLLREDLGVKPFKMLH